jgi:hypothetical protein
VTCSGSECGTLIAGCMMAPWTQVVWDSIVFHGGAAGSGDKADIVHVVVALAVEAYHVVVGGTNGKRVVVRMKQYDIPVISEFGEGEDIKVAACE